MTLLADLVLLVHFAYVAFVVGGLALIWIGCALRWKWVRNWWFRVLHFAAIALVALEALAGVLCPLTWLEDALRPSDKSGAGFIQRWVSALLFWDFPLWVFTLAYVAFAVLVGLTYRLLPPRPRGPRQPTHRS
jgi:hypothetical protein